MDLKEVFAIIPADKEGNEFIITIGNHLATEEKFPSKEAAEERINATDWNLVSAMIYACKEADEYERKMRKQQKLQKKEEA